VPRELPLRGDVGVLIGDHQGQRTVARYYWANDELLVMGDLPAESRIHPQLWGHLRFRKPDLGDLLEDALDGAEEKRMPGFEDLF
jgi:hypothetical protein